MKNFKHVEKGQFVAFVAAALIILGLFVGIAIDGGRAYLLRSRLYKLVDPMALAGALAMAGVTNQTQALQDATTAACDVAKVNGIPTGQCGNPGDSGAVVVVDAVTAGSTGSCSPSPCVAVSATQAMNTSFMRLAKLIGCTTCDVINVAARAVASPESISADIVLVMDDTSSMIGPPLTNAKIGASALVDTVMPSAGSNTQIGLVPFRGCYDTGANCVSSSSIKPLTNVPSTIKSGINALTAAGHSGTNVCLALEKGREVLLGTGSRPNVRRIMMILTDTDNHPLHTVTDAATGNCGTPGTSNNATVRLLDIKTNDKATALKDPAGDNIEIFVLRYSKPPETVAQQAETLCDLSLVGNGTTLNRNPANDTQDRNLARCIATTTATANPNMLEAAGHIFVAASEDDIKTQFGAIATEILKRLRLVS